MRELERTRLTDEQRDLFLKEVGDGVGTREALRRAGITGGSTALTVRRSEARRIINADEDLRHDYEIARGRDLDKVEGVAFTIATDVKHPRALDAAKFLLERRHPDYAAKSAVDVTHSGEVANTDVAAAIERFTSTVVRLAGREPAELPPGTTGG